MYWQDISDFRKHGSRASYSHITGLAEPAIYSRYLQQASNKIRAKSIFFRGRPDQLLHIGILISEVWDFATPVICKDEETWRSKKDKTSSALLFLTCKSYFRFYGRPPLQLIRIQSEGKYR